MTPSKKRFRHLTPFLAGLVALVLLPVLSRAQATDAKQEQAAPRTSATSGPVESAVFNVRYADVHQVRDVLEAIRSSIGGSIRADSQLRVIVVSGPKEMVAACGAAIKNLDVPPIPAKRVDLSIYIIRASKGAGPSECPTELSAVCAQLTKLASFQSYRLLDALSIQTRDGGQSEVEGVIGPQAQGGRSMPYKISFRRVEVFPGSGGNAIRLQAFTFESSIENRTEKTISTSPLSVRTDVEFAEGQKTVVGMASAGQSGDTLVIVLSGKVSD